MMDYLCNVGASPGRGGYNLSLEAGRIVLQAREAIHNLFNAPSEDHIIFTPNVTYASIWLCRDCCDRRSCHNHQYGTQLRHQASARSGTKTPS